MNEHKQTTDEPLRVALAGGRGRMGSEVRRLIAEQPERFRLVAVWGSCTAGDQAGESEDRAATPVGETNETVDVIVDFTLPAATARVAEAAEALNAAWVNGVTGLGEKEWAFLEQAARRVPVLHADNFSVGIAVLGETLAAVRDQLGPDFDIEISETHHRRKRDAPSGTARMLGRRLGDDSGTVRTGCREAGEIGYAVRRGGGVIGEHAVTFFGSHERLELAHHAEDRSLFAAGALRAANWLRRREAGLYDFREALFGRGE